MAIPNWANRTLWTGDNLDIMRGMNSESVDLIYLDPPFNSNRDYAAPIGSEAAGAAFKDTWTLNDVDEAWHGEIADRDPTLYAIIDAAAHAHGKGMKSYLIMMAVRLMEMRRILKDTGSIYLHCDSTASHYLKTLMDAVFGAGRFRNEVVWQRNSSHNDATAFGRVGDRLLFLWHPDTPECMPCSLSRCQCVVQVPPQGPFGVLSERRSYRGGVEGRRRGRGMERVEPYRHWATLECTANRRICCLD